MVPFSHASSSLYPIFRYCVITSVTTIELSIMFPSAKINPESVMMLTDCPKRKKKIKVVISAVVMLIPMIKGDFASPKKSTATTNTSRKPITRFSCKLEMV